MAQNLSWKCREDEGLNSAGLVLSMGIPYIGDHNNFYACFDLTFIGPCLGGHGNRSNCSVFKYVFGFKKSVRNARIRGLLCRIASAGRVTQSSRFTVSSNAQLGSVCCSSGAPSQNSGLSFACIRNPQRRH